MDTDALSDLVEHSTRDEFIAKLPHQFLLLEQGLPAEDVGFATRVLDSAAIKRASRLSLKNQHLEVLPIVKAEGNPYPDRVSVGRARNCDVVMRDPSVSKLHAHFRLGSPTLELVDIDSQNGTRVNGRPLPPHQPAAMSPGDIILFGSVAAKLVDAAALYDILK